MQPQVLHLSNGEDAIILEPGDSIYFDASIPHTLAATSRTTARLLSVSHSLG